MAYTQACEGARAYLLHWARKRCGRKINKKYLKLSVAIMSTQASSKEDVGNWVHVLTCPFLQRWLNRAVINKMYDYLTTTQHEVDAKEGKTTL